MVIEIINPILGYASEGYQLELCLKRNAHIFTSICLSTGSIIIKIDRMLLLWFNAALDSKKEKLEESMSNIKRSLDFLTTRDMVQDAPSSRPSSLGKD